jgi:hypothetical protein
MSLFDTNIFTPLIDTENFKLLKTNTGKLLCYFECYYKEDGRSGFRCKEIKLLEFDVFESDEIVAFRLIIADFKNLCFRVDSSKKGEISAILLNLMV